MIAKPSPGGDPVKPRFAGEQQVSTAILALTSATKPKVCFMRPGGPPVTEMNPYQATGNSFAEVASRLRDYNFTVMEKDFTGMYAMQAQMQGQQVAPEPSDDDIKDAIWIVLNVPVQGQMGMPPPTIAAKLAEHLENGGAALILNDPKADSIEAALSPWGVKIDTDLIAVKQLIPDSGGRQGDQVEQAERRYQHVFILKDFGESVVTDSLRSLDAALVPIVPIEVTPKAGFTASAILPIPQTPPSWATPISNFTTGSEVKYNSATDKAPPIFGGAVVEKTSGKGGRLVVIGAFDFATDTLVTMPDEEMARQGYQDIPRFPGNAELFANSIYWLAHLEPMIAISPSAMQVSRIAPMSDAAARGWDIGVLLIGLPGLVVVAGIGMYLARRD